jgi:SAM-dependent methyltransferase
MTSPAFRLPRPLDPLAPGESGRYQDDAVQVARGPLPPPGSPGWIVRTEHFAVRRAGGRVLLRHRLPVDRVDNDVVLLLVDELFAPGWLAGTDLFERLLTGLVRSGPGGPVDSWVGFYRRTLRRLDDLAGRPGGGPGGRGGPGDPAGSGVLAGYLPVYTRAERLVGTRTASVLDLGCCFGFFAVRLARRRDVRVTASDRCAGTVDLLGRVLPALLAAAPGQVRPLLCDAAEVPLPDGAAEVVTTLHLLEHLPEEHSARVLTEALRLARRRVLVAVPYEPEPDPTFGHVRRFDADTLAALARDAADPARWVWRVSAFHGGWLVLDRR